jgi:hypothetical protein
MAEFPQSRRTHVLPHDTVHLGHCFDAFQNFPNASNESIPQPGAYLL